jgi:hypothetical protein
MSVSTDGYNCENKNVHVRGEESKLITRHRERGWLAPDSNPPENVNTRTYKARTAL